MSQLRLAKRISQSRLCSRRKAEQLIQGGVVSVDNRIENDVKRLVDENTNIRVNGQPLTFAEAAKYRDDVFLCYKLRQELVTYDDPQNRDTLFRRLERMGLPQNLISVGRLDMMSEGLILLTTDGEFARKMELPENNVVRRYRARISNGVIKQKDILRLCKGISVELSSTPYKPIGVKVVAKERKTLRKTKQNKTRVNDMHESGESVVSSWVDVTVTEGKYREVRKALESCGLQVDRLIRTHYGPYSIGNLSAGSVLRIGRRKRLEAASMDFYKRASIEQAAKSIRSDDLILRRA